MRVKLNSVVNVQFGFYEKPKHKGNAAYVQVKHFSEVTNQVQQVDSFVMINRKNESHLLNDGDVLFVGKGNRNFAWTYNQEIGPAMASSIFFVLKPNRRKVVPEYLTMLFNTKRMQTYFETLGAGSSIRSIRKSELEALMVQLPSLELQQKAVELEKLHQRDLQLSRQLIVEKKRIHQETIKKIIEANA